MKLNAMKKIDECAIFVSYRKIGIFLRKRIDVI
jgi:hypothetical protein